VVGIFDGEMTSNISTQIEFEKDLPDTTEISPATARGRMLIERPQNSG